MEERKNETMTVKEVLEITSRNLKTIMIPVELSETIGQAILGSIRNIDICLRAMEETNDGGEGDGSDPDPE